MRNIFAELLKKEQPMITDSLDFQTIQAEIDQCIVVMTDYTNRIAEGLSHMSEIRLHVDELQKQQLKILCEVPPLPGLEQ